jgi:hypothetical protein
MITNPPTNIIRSLLSRGSLAVWGLVALCIPYISLPTANTVVAADAQPTTCDSLSVSLSQDKNFYVFTAKASGANSNITGYTFAFGDSQSYKFTFPAGTSQDHHSATITHAYQKAGVFAASVRVNTKVNGKTGSATSEQCKTTVTVGAPATSLPNTGAGNTIAWFFTASIAGVVLHQYWLRRRIAA